MTSSQQIKKDTELPAELYRLARQKGTEPPFSGQYWNSHEPGTYRCAICGNDLFSSVTKFDSHTGWPSFTDPVNRQNVILQEDTSHGLNRTEVLCRKCGAHLGHVFNDGPQDRGGQRYCINSACLRLDKSETGQSKI